MEGGTTIRYSIVIPLFNEQDNVRPLYTRILAAMKELSGNYEIVFVDDGSRDETFKVLATICDENPNVVAIRLRRNFGQTAGLQAGFDHARGEIIICMDGDLQHDPAEIPAFIAKMSEGYDIVSGWRFQRRDAWLTRQLPSRAANWIMAKICGLDLHDFGTTFKAYRRDVIKDLQLYGQLHRFIPALASWSGASIAEIPIKNPSRTNGKSNYGLSRTFTVMLDLICIKFLLDYSTKPLQLFGTLGLLSTAAGSGAAIFLLIRKFIVHVKIMQTHGPLFLASILLIICGIQLISLGLVGEMMSRTYYETQKKRIYAVAETRSSQGRSFPFSSVN
jgi:glycosyltransferase involved in cell wall biosynthesis